MAKLFHVLTPDENHQFINETIYHPVSLDNEKFIHLSKAEQIESVIQNFYSNHQKLILWRISESSLDPKKLVYEPPLEAPNSGVLFPHYYGEIETHWIEKRFNLFDCHLPSNLLD